MIMSTDEWDFRRTGIKTAFKQEMDRIAAQQSIKRAAEAAREERRIDLLAQLSGMRLPNMAFVRECLIFLLGGP